MTVDRCGTVWLRQAAFYMEISNNDLGQFYHTFAYSTMRACSESNGSIFIGYWFSVNSATSTFNISADFLVALNVLFNFHFKRTRVI